MFADERHYVKKKMHMSDTINLKDIGKRIKEIREEKNLTQDIFAKKIKISRGYLSELEHGKAEFSRIVRLAICNVFAVRQQWILYGEGPKYDDRWELLKERARELGEDIYQKLIMGIKSRERLDELYESMPVTNNGQVTYSEISKKLQPVLDAFMEIMTSDHEGVKLALTQNIFMFQETVRGAKKISKLEKDIEEIKRVISPREDDFKTQGELGAGEHHKKKHHASGE